MPVCPDFRLRGRLAKFGWPLALFASGRRQIPYSCTKLSAKSIPEKLRPKAHSYLFVAPDSLALSAVCWVVSLFKCLPFQATSWVQLYRHHLFFTPPGRWASSSAELCIHPESEDQAQCSATLWLNRLRASNRSSVLLLGLLLALLRPAWPSSGWLLLKRSRRCKLGHRPSSRRLWTQGCTHCRCPLVYTYAAGFKWSSPLSNVWLSLLLRCMLGADNRHLLDMDWFSTKS